jgi:hypothetical protein
MRSSPRFDLGKIDIDCLFWMKKRRHHLPCCGARGALAKYLYPSGSRFISTKW